MKDKHEQTCLFVLRKTEIEGEGPSSSTREVTSLPNGTSRRNCHHWHGCIESINTSSSCDPVKMRFLFSHPPVPEFHVTFVNFSSRDLRFCCDSSLQLPPLLVSLLSGPSLSSLVRMSLLSNFARGVPQELVQSPGFASLMRQVLLFSLLFFPMVHWDLQDCLEKRQLHRASPC
jgi:hypothetical protein